MLILQLIKVYAYILTALALVIGLIPILIVSGPLEPHAKNKNPIKHTTILKNNNPFFMPASFSKCRLRVF
jgi:hypothetical protein